MVQYQVRKKDSMRKSVLITGASSGIGREIVRILASSYDVIIHYNNNYESALELKKEIEFSILIYSIYTITKFFFCYSE